MNFVYLHKFCPRACGTANSFLPSLPPKQLNVGEQALRPYNCMSPMIGKDSPKRKKFNQTRATTNTSRMNGAQFGLPKSNHVIYYPKVDMAVDPATKTDIDYHSQERPRKMLVSSGANPRPVGLWRVTLSVERASPVISQTTGPISKIQTPFDSPVRELSKYGVKFDL